MKNPSLYKFFVLIFFFTNCDKEKGGLELTLLTNEIVCIGNGKFRDTNNQTDWMTDKVYDSISRNIVKSKLTNNSTHKYFIVLNQDFVEEIETDKAMNASTEKKMSKRNSFSLNLYQDQQILEGNITLVMGSFNLKDNQNSWIVKDFYNDSTFVSNTNKKKLYGSKPASVWTREVLEHSFVINPGETKYFTSIVNLPYRKGKVFWLSAVDRMKPNKASLTLVNNQKFTEEFLSDDQKKEIEENGYILFNGAIKSNSVPVKMVNLPN